MKFYCLLSTALWILRRKCMMIIQPIWMNVNFVFVKCFTIAIKHQWGRVATDWLPWSLQHWQLIALNSHLNTGNKCDLCYYYNSLKVRHFPLDSVQLKQLHLCHSRQGTARLAGRKYRRITEKDTKSNPKLILNKHFILCTNILLLIQNYTKSVTEPSRNTICSIIRSQ